MSYRAEPCNFFPQENSFVLISIKIDEDLILTNDKSVIETNFSGNAQEFF